MRNISQVAVSLMLLATQANVPYTDMAASVQASAQTQVQYEVSLKTNTPEAIEIKGPKVPDYDAEVLVPLRAAQAAEAARKAAEAEAEAAKAKKLRAAHAAIVAAAHTVVVRAQAAPTPENMLKLRLCESGSTYTRNSGNGYYGAYQYNIGTWAGYGGYVRPDLAPAAVQDAKFMETFSARGWAPWPACSRKLGFM